MRRFEHDTEWRWSEERDSFTRSRERGINRDLWPASDMFWWRCQATSSEHARGVVDKYERSREFLEGIGLRVVGERSENRINSIVNQEIKALGRPATQEDKQRIAKEHQIPLKQNGEFRFVDMQLLVQEKDGRYSVRDIEHETTNYRSGHSNFGVSCGSRDSHGRRVKDGPDMITGLVGYDAKGRRARR